MKGRKRGRIKKIEEGVTGKRVKVQKATKARVKKGQEIEKVKREFGQAI